MAVARNSQHPREPKKQTPEKAALHVLSAIDPLQIHTERIGERDYTIQELTAYRFLELSDLIVEQAEVLGEAGLLNQETYKALDSGDFVPLIKKLRTVWKNAPDVIGRFFALILSAEEEDDAEYILRNIKTFTDVPRVLKAFMKANPWRDLVDDFFQIGAEARTELAEVTEKQHTSSQS
jgi:hypothetical protein